MLDIKEIKEAVDRLESEIDNTIDLLSKTDSEFLYNALNELIIECNSLKDYIDNPQFYKEEQIRSYINKAKY